MFMFSSIRRSFPLPRSLIAADAAKAKVRERVSVSVPLEKRSFMFMVNVCATDQMGDKVVGDILSF